MLRGEKEKTHLSYMRVAKHLNKGFGEIRLADVTAEVIEGYIRNRLKQRVKIATTGGEAARVNVFETPRSIIY